MNIIKDDAAQSSAEFLMLFGGVIVIVIIAAVFYKNYLSGLGSTLNSSPDLNKTIDGINNLNQKLS
jgi:uncharacterized protein (UPF0333 family)